MFRGYRNLLNMHRSYLHIIRIVVFWIVIKVPLKGNLMDSILRLEWKIRIGSLKNLWLSLKSMNFSILHIVFLLLIMSKCIYCCYYRDHLIRQANKTYGAYAITQRFKNKYTTYKYFMIEKEELSIWGMIFWWGLLCFISMMWNLNYIFYLENAET